MAASLSSPNQDRKGPRDPLSPATPYIRITFTAVPRANRRDFRTVSPNSRESLFQYPGSGLVVSPMTQPIRIRYAPHCESAAAESHAYERRLNAVYDPEITA